MEHVKLKLINERYEMNKLYVNGNGGDDDTGDGQPPIKPPTKP